MTTVPIKTRAGDSLELDFQIVDEATGAAVDLSGAKLFWGIKPRLEPGCSAALVKSDANGIDLTGDQKNVVRVIVGKGEIPAGKFTHELEVTLPSGRSFTPISGPFDADPAVFAN
jgi:hypothetical protein